MNKLRILLLEADALDAEQVLAHLAEGGLDCAPQRVSTHEALRVALKTGCPDLILANYAPPAFDGVTALALAQQHCPQTPFLFVSAAMAEEVAVELLKSGATDYVLKQHLERLLPAVRRALREAEERAQRERLEEELRRRAEELAKADRRKDEFLALLAHELRNPLAPIRNAVQLMRLRGLGDPELEEARDVIDRQVQSLARLVEDLLDASRISRGKIELRRERVDLSAVATAAVETSRPLIDQRGHRLTVDLAPEPLPLHADPVRVQQVITNLLNNAAKYTEPGGHIRLATAREGNEAVFRVRDTGIGIPPEMQPRIFDLFMQADRGPARTQGGLGIGLALVRRLVTLHGGRIQVTSPGVGAGSEFTVRLPLARAAGEEAGAAAGPATPAAPARPKRVLVVDDNRDGAESLAVLLRLWGHDVLLAFDGPTALAQVEAERPDVVLLDIGLPGMDGYEVARRVRAGGLGRPVLVALTGFGNEDDLRRSREAGFDHHLTKPVDPTELERLLA